MGWLPIRWMAPIIFATALLMLAAPAHAEKRVALVIGNNDYRYVPNLGAENAALRSEGSQRHSPRRPALSKTCAGDQIGVGGVDLS
jgi:hypothetical protein